MKLKIDTKEKMVVLTPLERILADNMATDLQHKVEEILQSDVKNIVLNLNEINGIDETICHAIVQLQQNHYDANQSFVVCEVKPEVEEAFDKLELLELLNSTPTESEAWDIVQMEEIERELLDSDDVEFDLGDEETKA
jgi:anti-anti-sigma regulatory factor